MQDSELQHIAKVIAGKLNHKIQIKSINEIGGGCINHAVRLETNIGSFFVKLNKSQFDKMFEAEIKGLEILDKAGVLDVPTVISSGILPGNKIFLVLEWKEQGIKNAHYWEEFGTGLANLHKLKHKMYGLDFDNYIGSLPQSNKQYSDWISFFINERIEKQIDLAISHKRLNSSYLRYFNNLYKELENIFPSEPASLLHGDLWGGNVITNSNGKACIIDPAVYYGNREIEIAFTTLFGEFDKRFYEAYKGTFPMEPGFKDRKDIYNLYPLLVHLNIFGSTYLSGILRIVKKF